MRKRVALAADLHQRARDPADGRAVLRARRADPHPDAGRASRAVVAEPRLGHLRHARPRGGHRARRQGRGAHRRARPRSRRSSTIDLPRPRAVRRSAEPRFIEIYREIWERSREEVSDQRDEGAANGLSGMPDGQRRPTATEPGRLTERGQHAAAAAQRRLVVDAARLHPGRGHLAGGRVAPAPAIIDPFFFGRALRDRGPVVDWVTRHRRARCGAGRGSRWRRPCSASSSARSRARARHRARAQQAAGRRLLHLHQGRELDPPRRARLDLLIVARPRPGVEGGAGGRDGVLRGLLNAFQGVREADRA